MDYLNQHFRGTISLRYWLTVYEKSNCSQDECDDCWTWLLPFLIIFSIRSPDAFWLFTFLLPAGYNPTALWCVNTELSILLHNVALCQFWGLQKPDIILKDVGMGEISFLCIQCCRVCCFRCEMYNLCPNFSLWWFWESQGCFKWSFPVLCYARWLWCSQPLEGKDSNINKKNNWVLAQCTCSPGSCTYR